MFDWDSSLWIRLRLPPTPVALPVCKSTITLHMIGFCPETKEVSIDLNVVP